MNKKSFLQGFYSEKVVIYIVKEISSCVGKIINVIAAENRLDI